MFARPTTRECRTDCLQSSKVKAGQLWGKNKDELAKQLEELKTELNQLRVQKISSGASSKTLKMCVSDIETFSTTNTQDCEDGRWGVCDRAAATSGRTEQISEEYSNDANPSTRPIHSRIFIPQSMFPEC